MWSRATPSHEDALLALLNGWMAHSGPVTARGLAEYLGIAEADVDKTFLRMEAAGSILRGNFTDSGIDANGANDGLLARIHRLDPGRLRSEIQPVTAASSCDGCCAGNMCLLERRLWASTGLSRCCGNFRASKRPRLLGNGKFCRTALRITTRAFWISFA